MGEEKIPLTCKLGIHIYENKELKLGLNIPKCIYCGKENLKKSFNCRSW